MTDCSVCVPHCRTEIPLSINNKAFLKRYRDPSAHPLPRALVLQEIQEMEHSRTELIWRNSIRKRKQCNYLLQLACIETSVIRYKTEISTLCLHMKSVCLVIFFSLKCLFEVIYILLKKYHILQNDFVLPAEQPEN